MTSRFISPFVDVGSGIKPSSGAKLFFYADDGVTPKDTYSDQLSTPNSNPVIADSTGVFGDIYLSGSYKVTLQDKNGSQIFGGVVVDEFASGNFEENLITYLSQVYTFETVSAMVDSILVFPENKILKVAANNAETNAGGAEYKVLSIANYTTETGNAAPDGEVIGGLLVGSDWFLNGGNSLVAKRIQKTNDIDVYEFGYRGIGVINNGPTTIATPDATKDESPVLTKIWAYIERGASLDIGASSGGVAEFIQKGRYNVNFPSRSICNISEPMPYFINRCNLNFNNTEVRPTGAFVVLSTFGYNNTINQLLVNYEVFNTDEEIYEAHLAGTDANGIEIVEFGHPDIAFPLESFTVYNQCVITGGWDAFKGAREGILFGIGFEGCKAVNPLNWGFNLGDNLYITTTCTMSKPFVRLTKRSAVQHNGYVWRALQHSNSASPQEPPAVPVSSEYWQIGLDGSGNPEVVGSQDAWDSGTFYRSFGKHYRLINMSNLTLTNPSGDGGTDQSPIFEFSGINLDIDSYHLEKHQKVFSDRPTFAMISGALTMGTLYLAECVMTNEGNSTVKSGGLAFSCRVAHTSSSATEPLVGADWYDYWDKTGVAGSEDDWVDATDYTTGDGTFIKAINAGGRGITIDNLEQKSTNIKRGRVVAVDGENSSAGRVITGKGISRNLMKNMGGHTSLRGIVTPHTEIVSLVSILSNFSVKPRSEQNGNLFVTSLASTGTLTAIIDGEAPQGTKWGFYVANTTGGVNNPAGSIVLSGVNGAFFVGETTVTRGAIWVEKIGTAVNGSPNSWRTWTEGGDESEWIEFIPLGSHTTGAFTLPDSKTRNDIAEIKLNGVVTASNVAISEVIYYEEMGLDGESTVTFPMANPRDANEYAQLLFGISTTTACTLATNLVTFKSAYVKFR